MTSCSGGESGDAEAAEVLPNTTPAVAAVPTPNAALRLMLVAKAPLPFREGVVCPVNMLRG
ncbi:hypothetical protein GCM10027280_40210 [Micromonospora polyrhachis]